MLLPDPASLNCLVSLKSPNDGIIQNSFLYFDRETHQDGRNVVVFEYALNSKNTTTFGMTTFRPPLYSMNEL